MMYTFASECECTAVQRAQSVMEKSGMQHILKTTTFDAFQTPEPWQESAKDKARAFVNDMDAGWFFIGGPIGAGKSHLCAAITRSLMEQGRTAQIMLWRDRSVEIKALITDAEAYQAAINRFKTVDVLNIDDFLKTPGKENPTAGDVNLAFEIVNFRLNDPGKKTIISGERTIKEITKIDESIGSRIYQKAGRYCVTIDKDKAKNYRLGG